MTGLKFSVMNKRKLEFGYAYKRNVLRQFDSLYEKPLNRVWVARVVFPIQILLSFGGRCNRYFSVKRLQIYWLLNLMLFQFLLKSFLYQELFSCLQKIYHVTNYCKRPILPGINGLSVQIVSPHDCPYV